MKSIFLCLLLVCLYGYGANGKCFENCELYDILKDDLDGYHGYSAAQLVCLARGLTNSCTGKTYKGRGMSFHGMFKISSDWCDRQKRKNSWCQASCRDLEGDDLKANIKCLKHILENRGIGNWDAWRLGCNKGNVESYIKGCKGN